ncbi:MAG TPA: PhoH family protein, partial [Nitrospinaceae bacterium]|nr:PhoH family protein [Nitrospinaceae bacterium]
MTKKIYVLDTSVCLTDSNSLLSFENNDIVLPLKVLEEIDNHKKRHDSVGANAREVIRTLDTLRAQGNLHKGVRLGAALGSISTKTYDPSDLPEGFEKSIPDNEIIGTALTEKKNKPRKKVIVVSNDIMMRVKCDAIGLPCE